MSGDGDDSFFWPVTDERLETMYVYTGISKCHMTDDARNRRLPSLQVERSENQSRSRQVAHGPSEVYVHVCVHVCVPRSNPPSSRPALVAPI